MIMGYIVTFTGKLLTYGYSNFWKSVISEKENTIKAVWPIFHPSKGSFPYYFLIISRQGQYAN